MLCFLRLRVSKYTYRTSDSSYGAGLIDHERIGYLFKADGIEDETSDVYDVYSYLFLEQEPKDFCFAYDNFFEIYIMALRSRNPLLSIIHY